METDADDDSAQWTSRPRGFQFGLRALLIFATLVGCGLGWFGAKIQEGRRQQAAIGAIGVLRGGAQSDYFGYVTDVNLAFCFVEDADLQPLKWLTQLQVLRLAGTQVSDGGLACLERLDHLETLELSDPKITDAGLTHLAGLTGLKSLDLALTQTSDAGLEHLRGMTRLENLVLYGTQVTEAGVANLQKALPNCHIER
jgi:hypothetical protein